MKTSARNQLKGTIEKIIKGQVNSEVVIDVNGVTIKAIITNDAVEDMGLAPSQEVYAIIKASFVMIATEKPNKVSTRNVLETKVKEIINGAVNCELKLTMGSNTLAAIITEESKNELAIKENQTVYAMIKASSIILAQ